jgi:hypothetical protein
VTALLSPVMILTDTPSLARLPSAASRRRLIEERQESDQGELPLLIAGVRLEWLDLARRHAEHAQTVLAPFAAAILDPRACGRVDRRAIRQLRGDVEHLAHRTLDHQQGRPFRVDDNGRALSREIERQFSTFSDQRQIGRAGGQDRVVERVFEADPRAASRRRSVAHQPRVALRRTFLLELDGAFGDRGLVGAQHVHAAEILDRIEARTSTPRAIIWAPRARLTLVTAGGNSDPG